MSWPHALVVMFFMFCAFEGPRAIAKLWPGGRARSDEHWKIIRVVSRIEWDDEEGIVYWERGIYYDGRGQIIIVGNEWRRTLQKGREA